MMLTKQAKKVLDDNLRTASFNGKTFRYTVPSARLYPFQWFWDSCFHAIALSKLKETDRAKDELNSLLFWQAKDGFMPHMIYWDQSKTNFNWFQWNWLESKSFFSKSYTSSQIQPPVLALAVERIFLQNNDIVWLKSLLPKLEKYYNWLEKNRTLGSNPLITIFAPFESGMDQLPAFDQFLNASGEDSREIRNKGQRTLLVNKLLGYNSSLIKIFGLFVVYDVLFNSIYAQGLLSLSNLFDKVGNRQKKERYREKADLVTQAIIQTCWDPQKEIFFDVDARSKKTSKIVTVTSLFPLILPNLPKNYVQALVEKYLLNKDEFALPFPIPSVAANEPSFRAQNKPEEDDSRLIWRGPSWINTNWFIIHGLRLHGYKDQAKKLADNTKKLVEKSGFSEYYDPISGKPGTLSAPNLGWSTLAIDV